MAVTKSKSKSNIPDIVIVEDNKPVENNKPVEDNNTVIDNKPVEDEKIMTIDPEPESFDVIQVFQSKLTEYNSNIPEINKLPKEMQQFSKSLEKDFTIISKMIAKTTKKNKSDKPRPLSGFAVPSALTDELYDFLNIQKGQLVPRKDVTKMINDYIKDNSCRDEKDKRKIVPDAALKKLFKSSEDDMITYFNLQTYMKHHYIKN
jgi:chromatin remodeling complex protein RSC6